MENVKKDYFMDNHFRRKLHENIVKTRVLQSGFWNAKVTAWRCKRHCMSRKCCTIPIFGRFLESCYIAHPRSHGKVPKNPVRGYGIRGKTAFRQEKCRMIRNLPRNRNRATKFVVPFRGSCCSQLHESIGRGGSGNVRCETVR